MLDKTGKNYLVKILHLNALVINFALKIKSISLVNNGKNRQSDFYNCKKSNALGRFFRHRTLNNNAVSRNLLTAFVVLQKTNIFLVLFCGKGLNEGAHTKKINTADEAATMGTM